ncbi:sensor histidine kinase [Pseudoclavibacter helvolus]
MRGISTRPSPWRRRPRTAPGQCSSCTGASSTRRSGASSRSSWRSSARPSKHSDLRGRGRRGRPARCVRQSATCAPLGAQPRPAAATRCGDGGGQRAPLGRSGAQRRRSRGTPGGRRREPRHPRPLVTDLLDVSRLQSGALAVSIMQTDPADVIVPALDELQLGPDSVELALDPSAASVAADPALLQRVLVNLLANAVRHSPTGRRVRLATSEFGGRVQIRVVDHGPGIPAERREDEFVPFQRLGDTDNTTGLGLGLAISKGFVKGMHGTLVPEDTPGGGLTMVVTLPVTGDVHGESHGESQGGRA